MGSSRSSGRKKEKRKPAQKTRLSTSVHHYHYQNNLKNYIRRKPRPVLPCDAPPPHTGLRCNNEMPVCIYSTRITSIFSLGMCTLTVRRSLWPKLRPRASTSPPATFCSITALIPSIELFFKTQPEFDSKDEF